MSDILWLACHSKAPLDPGRIEQWAVAAERALPGLFETRTRTALIERHVALLAWADPASGPASWDQVVRTPRGLAVNDGFPIGFDELGLEEPDPTAISAALAADPDRVARMQPPYANVAIVDGQLRLATDATGFVKIYRANAGGLTAWASRASLAALFAFGRGVASIEGWTTQLSYDRFLGNLTPLAGVVLEAPWTTAVAEDAADGLRVHATDFIPAVFGHHVDPGELPEIIEGTLARFHRSLLRLGGSRVVIPFSGGRDSRLLAATAIRYGRVDELNTSHPPELDRELAGRLVERLDGAVTWTQSDKGKSTRERYERLWAAGTTTAELWDQYRGYQMWADGEGTPQPLGSHSSDFETVKVWGLGGEFARTIMYDTASLSRPQERTEAFWRSARAGHDVVNAEARRAVLVPHLDALRRTLEAHSVTGLLQLDYFYAFERARRVKNRVGTVCRPTGVRPFYGLIYARAGLGQTPAERLSTTYYEEIIRRAVPQWAGIPYYHQLRKDDPMAASALAFASAFWSSPYIKLLGADITEALSREPLVVPAQLASLLKPPAEGDLDLVPRMHKFNRILNFASYRLYLDALNGDFEAAGGVAVLPFNAPIPDVIVDLSRRRRAPTGDQVYIQSRRVYRRARSVVRRLASVVGRH